MHPSECRQRDGMGRSTLSGIRSVFSRRTQANARQGSTGCTLRSELRGIAKTDRGSWSGPFKGVLLVPAKCCAARSGPIAALSENHASPSIQSPVFSLTGRPSSGFWRVFLCRGYSEASTPFHRSMRARSDCTAVRSASACFSGESSHKAVSSFSASGPCSSPSSSMCRCR